MINRRNFLSAAATLSIGGSPAFAQQEDHSQLGHTPHTRFAINLEMWWTQLAFLERVNRAAALGFPAVEFWRYEERDLEGIVRITQQLHVEVAQFTAWGFEPGMNHPKNEESFLKKIEEACGVAHSLKCKKMTVVAGNNQEGMSQEQMLAQVTKALKRAAPIAERHRVILILEPMNGRVDHPGHCLYGSPDALRICREVNSEYVKINWDLYHMQITEGDLCGHLKEGWDQVRLHPVGRPSWTKRTWNG